MDVSIRSNGSVTWGHNGSAVLDAAYDSLSKGTQVGFSLSALLNTTIKEISPLKSQVSYTQSPSHVQALLDIEVSTLVENDFFFQIEFLLRKLH